MAYKVVSINLDPDARLLVSPRRILDKVGSGLRLERGPQALQPKAGLSMAGCVGRAGYARIRVERPNVALHPDENQRCDAR